MIRPVYCPAVLLSFLAFFYCNTPSEQPTKAWQDRPLSLAVSKPIQPDTAGVYQAFERYSKQDNSGGISAIPDAYWRLLTMIDARSGMIPLGTYFDDSTGFDALFFRKQEDGFLFNKVSSVTGASIAVPPFLEPESGKQTNTLSD